MYNIVDLVCGEHSCRREVIMAGFIDIHNHSLPGVDDGAQDWEMSLQMLRMAYDDGTRQIMLTPHVKPNRHSAPKHVIQGVYARLVEKCRTELPALTLHLGAEILFSSDLLEGESRSNLPTLGDSSYVLVEFLPTASRRQLFYAVDELLAAGYTPIIAHVERYICVRKETDMVFQLADMGALIQVNADSIVGHSGLRTKWFCASLLRQELVSFVGSDAHDPKHRKPLLSQCEELVHRKYGEGYARALFLENPMKVIKNQTI